MLSLVKTQKSPVRVVVFGNDWSLKNHSIMKSLENDLVKVEFQKVEASRFANVQLKNGFPLAAAYNVLAPCTYCSMPTSYGWLPHRCGDLGNKKVLSN